MVIFIIIFNGISFAVILAFKIREVASKWKRKRVIRRLKRYGAERTQVNESTDQCFEQNHNPPGKSKFFIRRNSLRRNLESIE